MNHSPLFKAAMAAAFVHVPPNDQGGGPATKSANEHYTELEQKRAEFNREWEKFPLKTMANGEQAREVPGDKIGVFRSLMDEINTLGEKWQDAVKSEQLIEFAKDNGKQLSGMGTPANRLDIGGGQSQVVKSIGRMFVESKAFKERVPGSDLLGPIKFDFYDEDVDMKRLLQDGVAVKTTMLTTANGYPPQVLRNDGVTLSAQRPPQIIDTMPMIPTSQTSLKWMAETVFTNNSVATAEGSAAGESVLTYAEVTAPLAWIPVIIPVTMQQLDDVPGLQGLIDQRLILMVKQTLDTEAMGGSGSSPHMKGFRSFPGVQTQARGTDPQIDAIRKAIDKVNVTGRARANILYMHSTDKMNVDLTRNTQGNYIFTNPLDGSLTRIWGLPIVENQVLSVGTSTVVDSDYMALRMRSGIEMAITDSHGSNFAAGIFVIRASVRAGVEVYRAAAICDVTGM